MFDFPGLNIYLTRINYRCKSWFRKVCSNEMLVTQVLERIIEHRYSFNPFMYLKYSRPFYNIMHERVKIVNS